MNLHVSNTDALKLNFGTERRIDIYSDSTEFLMVATRGGVPIFAEEFDPSDPSADEVPGLIFWLLRQLEDRHSFQQLEGFSGDPTSPDLRLKQWQTARHNSPIVKVEVRPHDAGWLSIRLPADDSVGKTQFEFQILIFKEEHVYCQLTQMLGIGLALERQKLQIRQQTELSDYLADEHSKMSCDRANVGKQLSLEIQAKQILADIVARTEADCLRVSDELLRVTLELSDKNKRIEHLVSEEKTLLSHIREAHMAGERRVEAVESNVQGLTDQVADLNAAFTCADEQAKIYYKQLSKLALHYKNTRATLYTPQTRKILPLLKHVIGEIEAPVSRFALPSSETPPIL